MVATRRGVRVCSPNKTNPEPSSEVQETPSTRRTRSRVTVKPAAESPTQHGAQEETSIQQESSQTSSPLPSSPTPSLKRCSKASRLHSPEQPCTPAGSVHEAGASDAESCCSVVSMEIPMTRTRGMKMQTLSQEEISEVESCSSAVSGSRRSTRKKAVPPSSHTAPIEAEDPNLGNDSCSSVVSESTRVTRSQRKPARTRSSATKPPEDSEISDADSCLSSASAARSTTRRSTRIRRQTGPIPIHLEEASEGSRSPRSRRSLIPRGAVDVSEPPSCDSDGFESGPTSSMTTRRGLKTRSNASDSEPMEIHSPSKGTPSSRTTRSSAQDCSVILEKIEQGDFSLNDSRLENTVIAADCSVLEGEKSLVEEEKIEEGVDTAFITLSEAVEEDVTVGGEKAGVSITEVPLSEDMAVVVISDDDSGDPVTSPLISEREPEEAAVTVVHQQEEPCADEKEGEEEEEEVMQEEIPPSQTSVTVTTPEEEGKQETEDVVVEKMDVSSLQADAQKEVESSEVEDIQVTSSQKPSIIVESEAEQEAEDVIVKKIKVISLLESSEDEEEEEEEEEEREVSEEVEKAGPSITPEAVDGLFMIDTRPGQEVDELYYKEKLTEEEEKEEKKKEGEVEGEDEEFVDEEGDDDDEDDMETEILFSSRNPHLKELSSRIDPGIRMKELGGLYINFDGGKSKVVSSSLQKLRDKKIQDEVMKKSVMGPDFEKNDAVPPYSEAKKATKLKNRAEREKSTGDGWFNMKAPELTQELKADLQVLKMRGSMDSKRFYKKNDREGFPKYFQVGTVVDSPIDFYHSRVPMKQRKRTMVEELLNDAEFRQNNKKKYQHILTERAAKGAGRKNKKKSKFHKK
ncbi:deoxynucleotidyltransferase terminal-interacting protein 2 [Trematomus bernacchii]|uniref:deoxynucleotidyltransferase terminal-interacting protein 2 n=1 Tax=Trematomus bernacchii TaxID=40690 RepID=UPI00146A1758|nr:deoxynucleotidyltransferase terminal-interacting protein 2 [Trematomus bernacchii]